MALLTDEDKILIKTLRLEKGWSVLRMCGALQQMVYPHKISDID